MLRIVTIIAAALIGAAVSAYGQEATKTPVAPAAADSVNDCDGGTLQLLECIEGKTKPWEKRLNAAYREALKDAKPDQREQLRRAQRLWVQYRDANCEYYHQGEGSIARVEAVDCYFRMTKSRAQELDGSDDRIK